MQSMCRYTRPYLFISFPFAFFFSLIIFAKVEGPGSQARADQTWAVNTVILIWMITTSRWLSSTGEYKLIVWLVTAFSATLMSSYICDVVFALGGSNDARWSGKKASTNPIDMHPLSRVAVNGMVLHGKMCKCIMKMISNSGWLEDFNSYCPPWQDM